MSASDLAEYLIRKIAETKLTKTEVAKRAGFSRVTLYKLLLAEVGHPSPQTLTRLAVVLNVAPSHLLQLVADTPLRSKNTTYPRDHTSFVRDVTYADNELVFINQEFTKIWALQNTGREVWKGRFLKCLDEAGIGVINKDLSRAMMLVPEKVQIAIPTTAPGQTVQLAVRFRAPAYPCTVISHWKMVDANGKECFPALNGIWCKVMVVAL